MASCENKYTTLLDLSRQAKIITGETACFNGKIEAGIPFSGYPTGVDTGTTVSLGFVSGQTAVFSGNTGTTVFDVSNSGSTNYNVIFSGYSDTVWSNDLYSGNTSGLTLPITTFSADTQIVGPFWTLTQTGMTGDYVIGTQYSGYSITYSFNQVAQLDFVTGYTAYSGFCSATQENFSAGTLDYKGPLDYISSVEDATVDGRLTTDKLTVTGGASASTIGYVLTQLDSTGKAGWAFNSASASTNTFVTGGTLTGTNLDLTWNTGGSVPSIELSGLTFTGNTSGDCINSLYVKNIYGCSPLHIEPSGLNDVYIVENGGNVGIGSGIATELLHLSGGEFLMENTNGSFFSSSIAGKLVQLSGGTTGLTRMDVLGGTAGGSIGVRGFSDITYNAYGKQGDMFLYSGNDSNGLNFISQPGTGTDDFIRFFAGQAAGAGGTPDLYIHGSGSTKGYVSVGHSTPTEKLDVLGSIKMVDGNEQNGYVMTSDVNGVGSWQVSSGGVVTGLTTTGTSGASTLVGGSLNVPEYAGGGGGATIDPYQNEGSVNSITWDVSGTSTNYEATLTGDTTLTMSNVRNGDYGTLIVTQDGTGSRTLTFGAGTHKVVNGGGGSPTLTTTAGATDILSFTYNGSTFYWTVGNDYT